MLHFHAVYTQDCDPGMYYNGSDCLDCLPGTFQDLINQTSCIHCPVGTSQELAGQESCESCPEGSFQDQQGQINCVLCPIGTYSNFQGAAACIPCGENRTTLAEGATSESQCVSTSIPTLSQWGLILLALSFTILGTLFLKYTVFRRT